MKNKTKGYPAPFQADFDREKLAFLNLANRGDGLTPINYIYSTEAGFNYIDCVSAIIGTIETNILYSVGIVNQKTISTKNLIVDVAISSSNLNIDVINSNLTSNIKFTSSTSFAPDAKFLNAMQDTNSDYIGFEPQSGVATIYKWPSPP